jgi:hypothetical protein
MRVGCAMLENLVIRVSKDDRVLLENMAKFYGVTRSDIIRIALKEFAKAHGFSSIGQRTGEGKENYAEVIGTPSS